MKQIHLFIIDPLEKLNYKLDSSLRMAQALEKMGHQIFFCCIEDLFWESSSDSASAKVTELNFSQLCLENIKKGALKTYFLKDFDGIHLRTDPPFDLKYITATWLLDSVKGSCQILNLPSALRSINEKISIFQYPQDILPALVSANPSQILSFISKQCHNKGIMKPLDLYGGRGIEILDLSSTDLKQAELKLKKMTNNGQEFRIIQPFHEGIYDGEIRVFCSNGRAIAWCLKKPAKGQYLANTRAGATLIPFNADKELTKKINNIAKNLKDQGIFFCGFDIIGRQISEINVTSPRLLLPEGEDSRPYYEKIAKEIEDHCSNRSN